MKTIINANLKQQAMWSITNAMESVIRTSPNQGDVIVMTGDNGIQYKVFTMHAFAHDNVGNNKDDSGDGGGKYSLLPSIRIMPATKGADCGISSNMCWRSYLVGLAPSMYLLVRWGVWIIIRSSVTATVLMRST
jgi:hypothetical protein